MPKLMTHLPSDDPRLSLWELVVIGPEPQGGVGQAIEKAAQDARDRSQNRAEVLLAQEYLPALESARSPGERRRLFRTLTQSSSPAAIIEMAFREYEQTGREAFLLHAGSLLEEFGAGAWPALRWVAASGRPETELFLGLIARCPGVSEEDRFQAFRLLSKHARSFVRLAMLEHLASLGPLRQHEMLQEVAKNDAAEMVRAEARDRLAVQTSSDL
jgi:hypothetical protein